MNRLLDELGGLEDSLRQLNKQFKMGQTKRLKEKEQEAESMPTIAPEQVKGTNLDGVFITKEAQGNLLQYLENRPLAEVKELYNLVINAPALTVTVNATNN